MKSEDVYLPVLFQATVSFFTDFSERGGKNKNKKHPNNKTPTNPQPILCLKPSSLEVMYRKSILAHLENASGPLHPLPHVLLLIYASEMDRQILLILISKILFVFLVLRNLQIRREALQRECMLY